MTTDKQEKKRTCKNCGKIFSTIANRKNHERIGHVHKSMAEMMIENQLDMAMGNGGDDWLTEMQNDN